MNPDDGTFHRLKDIDGDAERRAVDDQLRAATPGFERSQLVLPDGSPVPDNWLLFTEGERLVIKDHTFEVKWIGKDAILLQPVPLGIDKQGDGT